MASDINQDKIFGESEGDNWFSRNKEYLGKGEKIDWPLKILGQLFESESNITSIMELGCSNGWRLQKIHVMSNGGIDLYGMDASRKAIEDGRTKFDNVHLEHGLLADIETDRQFDLVIVNFVLHWIDRKSLSRSISKIDGLVKDGGYLLIGDFSPDFQQKRDYHHIPEEKVFTFKQDYAGIFEALGIYKSIYRVTYNHDKPADNIEFSDSSERAACDLLHKSLDNYYPKI